ncbi:SWIM zinc finger family protein [Hyphococcus sp.]|uniref:SWIM zinc finger family protein n=1 Tax=Hyphococcus sp. TaxID=2038636 RepID=UPI003CCBE692
MKETLKFAIVGEDDAVYEVAVERDTDDTGNLQASCSCGKAQEGEYCLHRFEVLEGETANLVSESLDDLQTLRGWIKGSDIEVAMQNLSKAKTELLLAHEKLDKCRRALVGRMLD